jgi:hypothetical protein
VNFCNFLNEIIFFGNFIPKFLKRIFNGIFFFRNIFAQNGGNSPQTKSLVLKGETKVPPAGLNS